MENFGFAIVRALVTDIVPDARVKTAMNEINAARREQEAALAKGEADKTIAVKKAEAEAESKRLQGEGIAAQRKAIIAGLKESVEDFQKVVEGATARDVMTLVLLTQYLDTLKEIGASANTNTVMLSHSPGRNPKSARPDLPRPSPLGKSSAPTSAKNSGALESIPQVS